MANGYVQYQLYWVDCDAEGSDLILVFARDTVSIVIHRICPVLLQKASKQERRTNVFVSWSLIIGLIVVVAMCLAAWFFSPKGENLT